MNTCKEGISRRQVLKGFLAIPLVSFVPSFFWSCKKNEQKNIENKNELSQKDQDIRNSLKYVDKTPIEVKTCDNCKLYTNPKPGEQMGGCQIISGPIHPKGYCISWIHRM